MELDERDRTVLEAVLAVTERGQTPSTRVMLDEVGGEDARVEVPLRLTRLQSEGLVIGPQFAGWLGEEAAPTAGWSVSRPGAVALGIFS